MASGNRDDGDEAPGDREHAQIPRDRLARIAAYQWCPPAGPALFEVPAELSMTRTSSGRPRQIHGPDGRLVTYTTDGRFTLGIAGGRRLQRALDAPAYRVVVGDESAPYVRSGRNAFAKFVSEVDRTIRPADEVMVVHEEGELLGVGRAELSGEGMVDFQTGMAVKVRDSAD